MDKNRNPKTAKNSKKLPRGRRKGTRISVQAPYVISAMAERFSLNGTILTYQDAADALAAKTGLPVARADAWRLAQDLKDERVPRTPNKLRAALGLPSYAPAPVCGKCGAVHVTKKCTANPKPRPRTYRYTEYPVWTLSDLADLAAAQPDARVVVLGVGAEWESVRVGWER